MASVINQDVVKVAVTDGWELFLYNPGDSEAELGPCEIFGFNVGVFTDKPLGAWVSRSSILSVSPLSMCGYFLRFKLFLDYSSQRYCQQHEGEGFGLELAE